MNIIGPDALVFGVDDVGACTRYLTDYGLRPVGVDAAGGRFEALDGTSVVDQAPGRRHVAAAARHGEHVAQDPLWRAGSRRPSLRLPPNSPRIEPFGNCRIGSIEAADDMGFVIGFQVTVRRPLKLPAEAINAPGAPAQRPANVVAVDERAVILPRTLSHVVYFVPDAAKAEAFYVERLGFKCTDRFVGTGPFLRPAANPEHHTLFLIQTPPFMKGCEHFTFHLGGPTELMQAGTRFVNKGYQSFWGPGRHRFGSNWFWYFNSPLSCHVEYDADMDLAR